MPALVVNGKGLLSVIATAKHIGIYPFSSTALDTVRHELDEVNISTTKGAIQLPNDATLPEGLLDRLMSIRQNEIEGN